MTGEEIFKYYLKKRNFTGEPHDQYAQLLQTIFGNIFEEIYPLLQEAERQGKRLAIREVPKDQMFLMDEICVSDVIFV